MKYSVDDKVKIVSKEFIKGSGQFIKEVEKYLESLSPKRVLTIKFTSRDYYYMKENDHGWEEDEIECLAKEEIFNPIDNRFEILDL